MRSRPRVIAIAILAIWASASPVRAGGGEPSPVVDGSGDAFDTFGAGPPLHDLDFVDVTHGSGGLTVIVAFHTNIAAPSTGSFSEVYGVVELDTDQSVATGIAPLQNFFSPPLTALSMGIDYYIDLGSEVFHPGFVDLVDASFFLVDVVPVVYSVRRLAVAIPLASLGGDDGVVDFTTAVGSFFQSTDGQDVIGESVPALPLNRSDCDGNGTLDIADPILHLSFLSGGVEPPCLDACDSNDDGTSDIADPIYTLSFAFQDGPPPPDPYPFCGPDTTLDVLGCTSSPECVDED